VDQRPAIGERRKRRVGLIKSSTDELAKDDADRVRAALASMVSDKFGTSWRPRVGKAEDIKKAYTT